MVFDGRFRKGVDRRVDPIGKALRGTGLTPDHLTATGLIMSIPTAWAIGSGRLWLGLVLLIAAAVPDLLDGALAKASGTASVRGAFFDSVADRVTDAMVLGGVAWYLQSRHHGHAALLPFAVLGVSALISYERAKAESLGFEAKGGLMERAERVVVLCIGLLVSRLLVPILWLMLVLTAITAIQRFIRVWRQASKPPRAAPAPAAGRWRTWRQSGPLTLSERYAQSPRRTSAAATWHERRLSRLERASRGDGDDRLGPGGRRPARRRSRPGRP